MKLKVFFLSLFAFINTGNASTEIIFRSNEKVYTHIQPLIIETSSQIHPNSSIDIFSHMGIDLNLLPRVGSPSLKDLELKEKTSSYSGFQEAQSPNYLEEIIKGDVSVLRFSYEKKRGYLAYEDGTPLKAFVGQLNDFHARYPIKNIAIDLSQRFIDTIVMSDFYDELSEGLKSKIKFFNLEGTAVDSDITDVFRELIEKDSFKYLVIIDTRAAESAETVSQLSEVLKNKIIFISQKYLQEEEVVKHHLGHIKTHKDYFEEDIFGK